MRERRYVKFRTDMHEDTKFKIIDMKPERDVIHYVWNRIVMLAGKVNLYGDLYLSKNIPYTIETLAIEFNRGTEEVKLALEVLIELEMVEFTENCVYRVKNFAKHQNIKAKEKVIVKDKEVKLKNKDVQVAEVSRNVKKEETSNLEIIQKIASNVDDNITKEKVNSNSQDSIPMFLGVKNNKRDNKKNKIDEILEESEDNQIDGIHNKERPLGKGERIMMEFSMCN